MSPHTTEPDPHDPTPAAAPDGVVTFCHHDLGGPCPGPAHTLLDEHFIPPQTAYTRQGRLAPRTLNEHVTDCDPCLRRLLGCARARGCDNAWATLEGAIQIQAPRTARKTFSDAFMRTEATKEAETRGLKMLWASPQLDPTQLAGITNLPGYLKSAMRNALMTWLREEKKQQGLWKAGARGEGNQAIDDPDPADQAPRKRTRIELPDLSTDPEAAALAHDQLSTLNKLLAAHVQALGAQRRGADRVTLFQHWFDKLMAGRRFNQTEAARTLTAAGIKIAQPTVHRWITTINLDLALALDDPGNGLSPAWRDAAIRFLCSPDDHDDPAAGDGEPTADPPTDTHTDLETGSDDD